MADDRHSFWSNEGPKKEFITMKTLEPRDNYPAAQVHKQRLRTTAPVYYSAQDFERREIYNILNRSNKQIDSDKSPSKKELREHRRKRRKEKKEEIKEERKERDKQFKAYNDFYKSLTKGIECIKYTVQPGESYKTIFDAYGYTFSDFDMIKEFNIDKQNDDFPSDFETPEEGSVIFIPINHNDNIRHWWRGWKAYQDGAKGLAYRIISGKENDPFWIVDKEEETRKIRDRRWFITKLFICNRLRFIRFNARNYFFENKGEVFRIDAWKGTYPQGVGAEVGIYKLDKKRGLFLPYTKGANIKFKLYMKGAREPFLVHEDHTWWLQKWKKHIIRVGEDNRYQESQKYRQSGYDKDSKKWATGWNTTLEFQIKGLDGLKEDWIRYEGGRWGGGEINYIPKKYKLSNREALLLGLDTSDTIDQPPSEIL